MDCGWHGVPFEMREAVCVHFVEQYVCFQNFRAGAACAPVCTIWLASWLYTASTDSDCILFMTTAFLCHRHHSLSVMFPQHPTLLYMIVIRSHRTASGVWIGFSSFKRYCLCAIGYVPALLQGRSISPGTIHAIASRSSLWVLLLSALG